MTTDTRPSGDTNVETGEWESDADTRPSVTVKGAVRTDLFGLSFVDTDGPMPLTDIGLQDGDEVEVAIRKHERLPANPWPAPRAQEGE